MFYLKTPRFGAYFGPRIDQVVTFERSIFIDEKNDLPLQNKRPRQTVSLVPNHLVDLSKGHIYIFTPAFIVEGGGGVWDYLISFNFRLYTVCLHFNNTQFR